MHKLNGILLLTVLLIGFIFICESQENTFFAQGLLQKAAVVSQQASIWK